MPDQKPPRFVAGESETFVTFLDYVRESLIRKLDGVSEADARRQLVPSGTSLLYLVQHLTAAEVSWFQLRFAGVDSPVPSDPLDSDAPIADQIEHYMQAIERSDAILATTPFDQTCADPEYEGLTLRWVATHMLEEISRHAGHADILREQIDGSTGR